MQLRHSVPIAVIFLMMATGCSSESSQSSKEFAWMELGKDMVREKLKDPDSARFRNVFFNRGRDNVPIACGEVNARNSFGGYTGFERFLSAGSRDLTLLESEASDFGVQWSRFCGR